MVVVIHHHDAAPAKIGLRQAPRGLTAVNPQSGSKPEGGALPDRAVHTHCTAHQFGQLLGNSQAQAGAAVFARGGGIGLLKTLEQTADLLLGQANAGVTHGKT